MVTISCCAGCTPETGRTAYGENGRNCHSYCEKYLREKAQRAKEAQVVYNKKKEIHLYNNYHYRKIGQARG